LVKLITGHAVGGEAHPTVQALDQPHGSGGGYAPILVGPLS
jgi:hypothetical protein